MIRPLFIITCMTLFSFFFFLSSSFILPVFQQKHNLRHLYNARHSGQNFFLYIKHLISWNPSFCIRCASFSSTAYRRYTMTSTFLFHDTFRIQALVSLFCSISDRLYKFRPYDCPAASRIQMKSFQSVIIRNNC